MLSLDHLQKLPSLCARKGAQAQPQRVALAAQGHKFAHTQGQAAVHAQMLRHIGHVRLPVCASKLNAPRNGQFANKTQQQGGFACPVGAYNNRAAACGRSGADTIKNKIAPPAEAYILKADRGGRQNIICQGISQE